MENEKRQDIRSVKQEIDKESDIIENELKQREYVDSGRIRYFSMFTGVGGFDLPLERFGFKCIGFSEIDKCCSELLKRKWPNVKNYGDCTKINPNELPDFDMLCGGFPCQSFSIAGKRRGFQDTRGTMFFEIARILEVKRPKLILLENVKGLLNHDKGETFKVILQTLEELGYRTQWMVLNSKFFGVPQNRERVFIIGSLGTESRPEILPFRKIDKENIKLQGHEEVTNTITSRITADSNGTYIESGGQTQVIHPCITEVIGRQGSSKEYIKSLEKINSIQFDASGKGYKSQQDRVYIPDGVMGTLPNSNPINKLNVAIPVLTPDRLEKRQNGRRFKENGDESFTLTKTDIQTDIHGVMTYDTNDSKPEIGQGKRVYGENRVSPPINQNWQPRIKSELIVHNTQTRSPDRPSLKKNPSAGGSGHIMKVDETYCLDSGNNQAEQLDYKIRRLTPTECERLQGFPDGWTEGFSDTQRYKMMGNAVTVNVIEAIVRRILDGK